MRRAQHRRLGSRRGRARCDRWRLGGWRWWRRRPGSVGLISLIDPTSRGEGGAARLREAGVEVEVGLLADEALVVLGPWLDALTSRRPRVGWVFESGPDGPRPCPEELLSRSGLRSGTDAVLHADGRAEETISGAHGPAAFALPHSVAVDDPAGALAALYAAGVRSLVLHGGPELAEPFLKQQLVDAVDVFLPVSAVSAPGQPVPVLPPDFQIRSVTWLDSGLFVQAERPESA